ncbi:MAG: hypothetical protein LBU84_10020 [Prevotella sp.]|jgi:hypothetical protein|nr:hypothetical protein [Prevotella sp.]
MQIKHLKYENDEDLINKTPNTFKNCTANGENLQQMKNWMDIFAKICKINFSMEYEQNMKDVENVLGQNIPKTLRLLYSYFGSNEKILGCEGEKPIKGYKFLKLDELKKIEKNVVIYDGYSGEALYETDILIYSVTQKLKNLYAIDLNKEWHLDFNKDKWYWVKDNIPLYKNILVLLACIFIANKNNIFKTNMKAVGSYFKLETVDKIFDGDFERFKDFNHYDHTLYYNLQYEAIIWFRAGNSCPELLFGCDDKKFTEEIIKKYDFNKAKIYK